MGHKKHDIRFDFIVNGNGKIEGMTLDLENLARASEAAAATVKKLNAKWYDSITKVSATCATFGASMAQLQSSMESLTAGYNDFDKAMRATNTMARKDAAGFEMLKTQVNDLSKSIPLAKSELASGLYQVISNGVPEDNWISYLEASAKASVGGIADLGQVVGVTSTIIKNYGLSWSEAASIQYKIQLTAINGVTSFEQLAAALPRVTGNAATLGVSIEELLATFATLTGVSGNTAEVSTQLAAIFTALVKPSSEAAKMAQQMGIKFDAAAIKAAGGMEMFLAQLDESVKTYSAASGVLEQEVYGKLFGSAEALRALVPLQGQLAQKFRDNTTAMADSAGVIGEAFANVNSTAASQNQILKNTIDSWTALAARAASSISPYLNFVATIGQATTGVVALGNGMRKLIVHFHKIVPVAKIAAGAATMLRNATKAAAVSTAAAAKGTGAMAVSVGALKVALVSTGIGALLVALGFAFSKLADNARKAAEDITGSSERIRQAQENMKLTEHEVNKSIQTEIAELKTLILTKGDATVAVQRLNDKYRDSFGTFETAAEWYRVLAKNAALYAKVQAASELDLEYSTNLSTLKEEKSELEARQKALLRAGKVEIKHYGRDGRRKKVSGEGAAEYIELGKQIKDYNTRIVEQTRLMHDNTAEMEKWLGKMKTADVTPDTTPAPPSTDGDKGGIKWIKNAQTLNDYTNNLSFLDQRLKALKPTETAEIEQIRKERKELQSYIAVLRERLGIEEQRGRALADPVKRIEPIAPPPIVTMPDVKPPEGLQRATNMWDAYTEAVQQSNAAMQQASATMAEYQRGAVDNITRAMSSMGDAIGGTAGAWLDYASKAISAIAQVLPQILALTNAQAAQAISGVTASGASLPPPFNFISISAGVAAVIAALASVPKFADGGIAYGPTLGLFGEYAGASRNPEVVAPLNTLRSLLAPAAQAMPQEVHWVMKRHDLVAILRYNDKYYDRV